MAEKDLGCLGEPEDMHKMPKRPGSERTHSSSSTVYNIDADIEEGNTKTSKEVDSELEIFEWSGPHDPNHPQNWALPLKLYIGFLITIITMVVSINSSIYNTGAEQEIKEFGISTELNVLGTSLFLVVRVETQMPKRRIRPLANRIMVRVLSLGHHFGVQSQNGTAAKPRWSRVWPFQGYGPSWLPQLTTCPQS